MRTAIDSKGISMHSVRALALALFGLCALAATGAQAAPVPAPGLKVVAVTGPTNLPPVQSEIQRVTDEADGGTFKLATLAGEGKLTPVSYFGAVATTEGSPVLTIESVEGTGFHVGDRVGGVVPFGVEAFVVSCSPDCVSPGSTVTLSEPAEITTAENFAIVFTKEAVVEEGAFPVGAELQGIAHPYFAPGTTVSSATGSTITFSKAPTIEYFFGETVGARAVENTVPIAFNAPPSAVQSALEAVPALGPGSVVVSGGPGGSAETPYFLDFGGPLADQDVAQLTADSTELTGEHHFTNVFTTVPGGPGTGEIVVLPANIGALPTSGLITAKVGPLPQGIVTTGKGTGKEWTCPGGAGDTTIECTSPLPIGALRSGGHALSIPIEVEASAELSATAQVELSGGGSPHASTYELPIVVSEERAPFGVSAAWGGSFEADGSPSTQAGGHPFSAAAYIMLNSVRLANGAISPAGDSKNIVVNLPPGFVGNPLAGKRCPQNLVLAPQQGGSELCNEEMTLGNLDPYLGELKESLEVGERLYNDMPPHGVAAEFTTRLLIPLQSVIASVNSEEDFGLKLNGPNNANYLKIYGAFTAFEGLPAHGNGTAFLTSPTNCAESAEKAPTVKGEASTFQDPTTYSKAFTLPQPALSGCDQLKFEGVTPQTPDGQVAFSFTPHSADGSLVATGSTPVAATAHLHIANPGLTDPKGLATPELKRAVIKLPEGMSLNPSSANGLEGCSEAQIGYKGNGFPMPTPIRFTNAQPACPDGSKIGSAEIKTPLLDNPLVGEIFLANQGENPFGSLLAVYLVVNDPLTGVLIKLPGDIQPDPQTGRLTAVFDNNPQLPFEDLFLRFRGGGPRSLFATSEVCGNFPTEGEWTPWSAPESGPPAQTADSFTVSSGCSASAAAQPFAPSFEAGTTNTTAGSYSPLVIKVNRKDGEGQLRRFEFTLPQGLTGKLKGIPNCSEAQIHQAEARTGKAEQASPSCPAASKLGTIDAGAGVGSEPFHVQGNLYLSGPYEGAPLSAVAITPALAGPYDLGTVVVRTPLYLNPETSQLTAKSDPIPTILKGIPLKIRSVAIQADRSGFILNPTSCEASQVTGVANSTTGGSASLANRFQVGGCDALKFAPKLEAKLKGGTKRGDHPALTATVTYPQTGSYANLKQISVTLPHSEFLENAHIGTVCTRVQFSANACPAASIYGKVSAETPLLDQPLTGNVYLRSSSNKLPDMVLALHGPPSQPIEIDLDGRIDSINGGIRSTFEAVPDAPVSRVVLSMFGGKKGLLVNSRNLCTAGGGRMSVKMTAHNNRRSDISPALKNQCSKAQRKGHKKKASKGSKKRTAVPKRPW